MKLRVLIALLLAASSLPAQTSDISLYLEEGKSGSVWGVILARDGQTLYSCGRDSTAKVWNTRTGECRRTMRATRPTLVTCLALHPDQQTLAIGDMNGVITVFNVTTGAITRSRTGHSAYILSILWTPDGRQLITAGRDDTVRVWDPSLQPVRAFAGGSLWVNDLSLAPDGRTLLTAGQDGSVRLWSMEDGTQLALLGRHNRFARCVTFAPDGRSALSGGRDGQVRVWNIGARALQTEFTLDNGFAHHIAIDPRSQTAYISMMDNCIEAWNWQKALRVQRFQEESYGAMNAIYAQANDRLYSAHTAGAIRVWNCRANANALLVSMVGFSDGQWLTSTVDGYYDCSTYGDRYVQWRRGTELFPLERYEADYHRVTIIEDALSGAYTPSGTFVNLVEPPRLAFLSPRQNQLFAFGSEPLEVLVELEAVDRRGVSQVELAVNGRLIPRETWTSGATVTKRDSVLRATIRVRVLPGTNTIEAWALNASRVRSEAVRRTIKVETDQKLAPNLYVLTVGVDQYAPAFPDLNYASNDARQLGEAFGEQEGRFYSRVYVKTLVNRDATKAGILKALGEFPPMAAQDVLVLFFSGHGVRAKDAKGRVTYYYVASGSQKTAMDKTGLSWTEVSSKLSSLRAGRVILFLDACHSGSVSEGAQNEKVAATISRDMGIVFSSSSGSEFSYENTAWKHGAFTLAILQALKGDADFTKNNTVDWTEFQLYVISRVKELTGNNQNPTIPRLEQFSNFDFVRVR